jgi:phage shock protein B
MHVVLEGALVLVLAGVAALVLALVIKMFRGAGNQNHHAQDSRMIQETYQGLSRLEKRIEALETIVHDRKREDHGK